MYFWNLLFVSDGVFVLTRGIMSVAHFPQVLCTFRPFYATIYILSSNTDALGHTVGPFMLFKSYDTENRKAKCFATEGRTENPKE